MQIGQSWGGEPDVVERLLTRKEELSIYADVAVYIESCETENLIVLIDPAGLGYV